MIEFRLDPPSGHADSYFDVEFIVKCEEHPKTVISFFNDTSKEDLLVLGVNIGYISKGKFVVVKSKSQVQGHLNIFNDDKMNKRFGQYSSVVIRCKIEHFDDNDNLLVSEESEIIFYNESHSLDAGVIPFDLFIQNQEINVSNREPLRLEITTSEATRYELCIKSRDDKSSCHIEVSTKPGKTYFEVPGAMLYYDLDLLNTKRKRFDIYYVKFQGTTMSRVANRKYLIIPLSEIKFIVDHPIVPDVSSRLDPAGRVLPDSFVLSDRYLVMCPREFSGFARKSEFSQEKLMDLTMLVNEGQHMESLSNRIRQFSSNDEMVQKIEETNKAIQNTRKRQRIRPKVSSNQFHLMRSISGVYESLLTGQKPASQPSKPVSLFNTNGGSGCAPCARKKNKPHV